MYRLLIVDDEIHAAHGIEIGINWANLGISNVYVAYNIRQAMEIFFNHAIDLMICDIEMPQGNGLELLAWVKEHYASTETLFLTCHADFDYAKQALQLGSFDYLLKPVRYKELESVVMKAIEKVKAEREADKFTETLKHYYELWSKHHPLLVERFWFDLIHHAVSLHPEQILEMIQTRNIPYHPNSQFVPILIAIHEWSKEITNRERKILEYALRNAAEHSFQLDGVQGLTLQLSERHFIALFPAGHPLLDHPSTSLIQELSTYISNCETYFYSKLSCYVGIRTDMREIHHAVEDLIRLDTDNVAKSKQVYRIDEPAILPKAVALPNVSHWLELLKQGAKLPLISEIHHYLEDLKQGESSAIQLQEFFHDFMQMVYHVLQLKGLQAHRIFTESMSPVQVANATRSISALKEWSSQIIDRAAQFIRSVEESQSVIDRVRRFIKENIKQDLSRDDISEHVFLSPDYLSRLFKKETGISLNDYMIEERFKYAKELLISTDMPISSIAAAIGYTNFSHFSKMFKRVTNMNPLEFRKKCKNG
ncbi:helix-turn-helix domain-containing protein [Paenibacillus cremeus]|nr:helix-turn-helix domain-containing protein [Paenibacillus cremeus]